jgi:hypothetical protein
MSITQHAISQKASVSLLDTGTFLHAMTEANPKLQCLLAQ